VAELTESRETVRERYGTAARAAAAGDFAGARAAEPEPACGTPPSPSFGPATAAAAADEAGVFGSALYDPATETDMPEAVLNASLGCGVPTAVVPQQLVARLVAHAHVVLVRRPVNTSVITHLYSFGQNDSTAPRPRGTVAEPHRQGPQRGHVLLPLATPHHRRDGLVCSRPYSG
jgi:hypothetical protein